MPKGRYLYIEAESGGDKIRERPLRPGTTFTRLDGWGSLAYARTKAEIAWFR